MAVVSTAVHVPDNPHSRQNQQGGPLSRQPVGDYDKAEEKETEEYIYSVVKGSVPHALTGL